MIEVIDLKKQFYGDVNWLGIKSGIVNAVNGVSFTINEGETLGLVGESGSGKSTLGRLLLRLLEPTSGSIILNGEEINKISVKKFRTMRKELQIIFQNPYAALDDRMIVEDIIYQPLQIHKIVEPSGYKKEIYRLLDMVGLSKDTARKLPHELSGGQRQRVAIAKAISTKPKFLVCDEPVSSLDVSVQSQILNLIMDLQKELNLSCLFISHDLNVISHVSNKIAVMYLGEFVEYGDADNIIKNSKHPYTKALFSAGERTMVDKERDIKICGEIPSAMNRPEGCVFCRRCPQECGICSKEKPVKVMMEDGTEVSCHLYKRGVEA